MDGAKKRREKRGGVFVRKITLANSRSPMPPRHYSMGNTCKDGPSKGTQTQRKKKTVVLHSVRRMEEVGIAR